MLPVALRSAKALMDAAVLYYCAGAGESGHGGLAVIIWPVCRSKHSRLLVANSIFLSFSNMERRPDAYAALLNCLRNPKRPLQKVLGFNVGTVLMYGFGGRNGGQIMPRVQLPAVTPKRKTWNKGRIIGQKRPLLPKQVWAIRTRLEITGNLRDVALFNVAIDSKLRGCDLVRLKVTDLVTADRVRERASVIQSKTNRPVQFELTENTRESIANWVFMPEMVGCGFMFPSRLHDRPHISTRQYGRLVRD